MRHCLELLTTHDGQAWHHSVDRMNTTQITFIRQKSNGKRKIRRQRARPLSSSREAPLRDPEVSKRAHLFQRTGEKESNYLATYVSAITHISPTLNLLHLYQRFVFHPAISYAIARGRRRDVRRVQRLRLQNLDSLTMYMNWLVKVCRAAYGC